MPWAIIGSAALSIGKRLIGSHLLVNHIPKFGGTAASAAASTGQALLEGGGMRFAAGILATLYYTNPGVRKAINGLIVALKDALL